MIFLAYNLKEKYKINEKDNNYYFYSSPYTNLEYNENLWIGDYSNIHSYILENVPYYIRCFENKNKTNSKNIETSLFYWRDLRYKYIPKIISVDSDIWNTWEDIITTEFNYLITKIYNEVYFGFLTKTITIGTLKIKELLDARNEIYNDSDYSKNNLSVLDNRISSYYSLFYLDNLDLVVKTRISSDLYSGKIKISDYTLLKIYTKLDYIENLVFLRQIQDTKEIATYLSNILDSNIELYYSYILQDLIFDTNSPNSNNLICSGLINFYPNLGVRISAKSVIDRLCKYSSNISNSEFYKATTSFENILTLENKNNIYKSIWKDLYLTNSLGVHKEYNENNDDSIDYKNYLRSYLYDINYGKNTYYYDINNGSSSKKERVHKLDLENLLTYRTQHYDYYIKKNLLKYDEYKKDEYGEYIKGVYNQYDEEPIKNIIKYISSVTRLNTLLNLNKLIYKDYYNYSLMNIDYYNNIKNIVSKYSSNFGLTLKTALVNRNNNIYQIKYTFYCDEKYYAKFNSIPDKINSKLLIYLVKYLINGEKLVGQENNLMSIINPNTGKGINIGTYNIPNSDIDKELNELEGKYTFTTYYFLSEYKLIDFHNIVYYNNSINTNDSYLYSITDLNHFIDVLPFKENSLGNITLEDYKIIKYFEYQESKLLFRLFPRYNLINSKLSPLFEKTITTMKSVNTNTINTSSSNLDYNTQITNCTSNDLLRNDLGFINYSNDKKEYVSSSYLELYRPLIENTLPKNNVDEYYKEVCKVYGYNQNIDNGIRDLENRIIKEKHYDEQYDYNDSNYILRFTNDSSIKIEPTDYYFNENIDTFSIPKNNTLTGFKLLPCRELYQINNNNAFKLASGYQIDNSLDYKDNLDKDLDDLEINEEYNSNWIWNKIGLGFCYRIKFSLLQDDKLNNNKICLLSQPLKDKNNNITRNINNIFNIILEKENNIWKLKVNLPLGFNEIANTENNFSNTILCKNIIFDLCSSNNSTFDLTINYKITSETDNYSRCKLYYTLISNNIYSSDEKEFDIKFIDENSSIEIDNEIVLENAIKLNNLGDIIRYNKNYSLKTCDIILFSIGYGYDSKDTQNFRVKDRYNRYIEYDDTIQNLNYAKYLEYGYLSLFGSIYEFELYCSPKENLIHYDYMLKNYDEILRLSYSYYNINFKSLYSESERTKRNYQITKLITTNNNLDLIKDPFYNLIDDEYAIWTYENKLNIDFDNSRFRTLHYLAENTIFDSFNEICNNSVSNFDTIVKYQNKELFRIDEDQVYSFINCELKDIVYDNTSLTKFSYTDNSYIKKLKDLEYLDITLPYCVSDTSSNTEINLNLENSLNYKFNNYNFINYIAKASNIDLVYYDDNIANKLAYENIYIKKTDYSLTGFNNSGILSPFYICEFSKRKIDELGTLDTYENAEYENKKIYEISSMNFSNVIIDNSLADFLNPINYYTEINTPFSVRDNDNNIRQYNKTYGIRTIQDGTYKFKISMPFKILSNTFTSNIYYLLTDLIVVAKTEYYDSKNIIDEIDEIPTEYRYNKENGINYAYKSYNNIKYIKDENNLRKAKTTITLLDNKGNILNYKKIKDKYIITSNIIFNISLNPYELKEIKFSLYNAISKKYAKDDNNIIKLNTNREYNILLDFNSLCYDLEILDNNTNKYKSLKKYKNNIKDFYILKGLIDDKYFSTKLSEITGVSSHFDIIKYDSNNKQYYLSCGYAYDLENSTWLKSTNTEDNNYIYLGDPNLLNSNNYLFKNHSALFSYSSVNLDSENLKKLFAYNIINYLVVRKTLDYNINKNTFNFFNNDNVLNTIGVNSLDNENNSKEYIQFAINNFDEEEIILKQAKELTDNINANLNEILINTSNVIYGISNFSFNFEICDGFIEGFDTYFYNRHNISYTQKVPSFIYNSNYNNQKIEYKNLEYNKLELTSNSSINNINYNLQNLIANENITEPYSIYFNNTSNIIRLTQINSTKIVINKNSIIIGCVKSLNNSISEIKIKANNKEIILYQNTNNNLDRLYINSSLEDLLENNNNISINDIEIIITFNSNNIENYLLILDSFKILNYTTSKNIMIGDTSQNLALKETENIENSITLESRFNEYNKINCLTYGNENISLFNKYLVYNSDGDVVYQNYEMYKEGLNTFLNPFNANLKIQINNCETSKNKEYLENKNLKVFEKYYLENNDIYFGYSISLNAYHKVFTHNKLIYNKKDNLELLKDISTLNLSKEIEKVEIKDIANLSSILKTTIERDIKNMFVNIDIDDFYINNLSISGHSWNNKKLENTYKFNTIILAEYYINTITDENDNLQVKNILLNPYFVFNFPNIEYDSRDSLLFEVINNDTKI